MVFDLVELQHFPYFTVEKRYAVIADNPVGHSKPHNYVFLDEICHCFSYGFSEWHCLCPLSEVLYSH